MSASCVCPQVEPIDQVTTGALRCGCCGGELRFTCDGECGEEHVRASFAAARAAMPLPAVTTARNSTANLLPKPAKAASAPAPTWECPRCSVEIPKKSGRRPKCCDACRTPIELARLERQAIANAVVRDRKRNPEQP